MSQTRQLFLISCNFWNYTIRILLGGGRTTNVAQCHQNIIGGAMPTPIIRILLAGGRTTKVEHSTVRILLDLLAGAQCRHQSSEYYERAGRPRESNTQNTIGGRAMPTPVIRILLLGRPIFASLLFLVFFGPKKDPSK